MRLMMPLERCFYDAASTHRAWCPLCGEWTVEGVERDSEPDPLTGASYREIEVRERCKHFVDLSDGDEVIFAVPPETSELIDAAQELLRVVRALREVATSTLTLVDEAEKALAPTSAADGGASSRTTYDLRDTRG